MDAEQGPLQALLLLGPTGSGKTPLGDCLERDGLWGRRCHHFDFGANLRAAVNKPELGRFSTEEVQFLSRILAEGLLLEDESFPLAIRILSTFVAQRGVQLADLLVLNGLPRHTSQAAALDQRLHIIAVVELDCTAAIVRERLRRNSGGDRGNRTDDADALVARKLDIYRARTRPLLSHYRERNATLIRVAVEVGTTPECILAQLAGAIRQGPCGAG